MNAGNNAMAWEGNGEFVCLFSNGDRIILDSVKGSPNRF